MGRLGRTGGYRALGGPITASADAVAIFVRGACCGVGKMPGRAGW